jgi:3-aminobutyryl-CoA ammonia-lyase
MDKKYTSTIRMRMSSHDAHYGGNLVDGARMEMKACSVPTIW